MMISMALGGSSDFWVWRNSDYENNRRYSMKKLLRILSIIVVIIISISIYKLMTQNVKYEVLNIRELPEKVQNEISTNSIRKEFSIHNDEKYSYIFYRADHTKGDYISTDLSAHKKNGEYIITGLVDWAVDDSQISYEKAIKLEKVSEEDIILKVLDKR
jgi:uncharacterized membrane protein